ncbi:type II secretion system protein GspL [Massilia sp. W12]|uniref:type II secretion system protein GspL n=1 Tax=Massilia sp. W12 TaxID=3126507 RepID=UPI0030D5FE0D
MTTLYIRHPARANAEHSACAFALVHENGAVQREGSEKLANLGGLMQSAKRVVLLLAAADVSLLRCKLPALPAAKLKLALPNLVEEQLLGSLSEQIVLAQSGPADADGMHLVAVVNKTWLTQVQQQLRALGAQRISAFPAQLCAGLSADAALVESSGANSAELTLVPAGAPAFGFGVLADSPARLLEEVQHSLRQLLPQQARVVLPSGLLQDWQGALSDAGWQVQGDDWKRWIDGARACKLDLMAGVAGGGGAGVQWAQWRWPLTLLGVVALVHIAGLNVEYLRAKREAQQLRQSINQTFRSAFPNEPIQDPVLQVRKKIDAGKAAAGIAAPDDFTTMSAAFGEALSAVAASRKVAGIASIEYKERSLHIKFKDDGEAPEADMKAALAARHLNLTANGRSWQVQLQK